MKSSFIDEVEADNAFEIDEWEVGAPKFRFEEADAFAEAETRFPEWGPPIHITPAPPTECPLPNPGITGSPCPSRNGKCWSGSGQSRDIVDADVPWNDKTNRSASNYSAVLDYFNPGTCRSRALCMTTVENRRYRPTAGDTYCNIYVHDVTRAMWASIPHWVKDRRQPNGWTELSANGTVDWMRQNARTIGWVPLDQAFCQWIYDQFTTGRQFPGQPLAREIATVAGNILAGRHDDPNLLKQEGYVVQQFANAGLPTVILWKNPNFDSHGRRLHGHAAMVRPGAVSLRGQVQRGRFLPWSAQAGRINFTKGLATIARARGAVFYVHP